MAGARARWSEEDGDQRAAASALYPSLSLPPLVFSLLPWLVLFIGVTTIYRLAPKRPTKVSEVWVGALAATALIRVSEWLSPFYAVNLAHFNVLYGTLGGVMAFLLSIYLSSCTGVFGVCFTNGTPPRVRRGAG